MIKNSSALPKSSEWLLETKFGKSLNLTPISNLICSRDDRATDPLDQLAGHSSKQSACFGHTWPTQRLHGFGLTFPLWFMIIVKNVMRYGIQWASRDTGRIGTGLCWGPEGILLKWSCTNDSRCSRMALLKPFLLIQPIAVGIRMTVMESSSDSRWSIKWCCGGIEHYRWISSR